MKQRDFARALAAGWTGPEAPRALMLAGSLGRGEADEWSDVDLLAVAPGEPADLVEAFRDILSRHATLFFFRASGGGTRMLVNAVTEDWLRVDLFVLPEAELLSRRAAEVVPLIDPDGLHGRMSGATGPRQSSPQRAGFLVQEILRCFGLLPVVIGRGEVLTGQWGFITVRDLYTLLLKEVSPRADGGGALHLSRIIDAADVAALAAIPPPGADTAEIVEAHLALARIVLPRARAIAAELGIDWPGPMEDALRRHLKATLGIDLPDRED
ncbi:hypothetical protein HKCCE2091_08305 [Rhodobacterales bacterium HKCCE2091]|nr:hypothetical protein [Rhodobacterales bacterium HKCCE2091]